MSINLAELNRSELFEAFRQVEIAEQRWLMAPTPETETIAWLELQAAKLRLDAVCKRNKVIA